MYTRTLMLVIFHIDLQVVLKEVPIEFEKIVVKEVKVRNRFIYVYIYMYIYIWIYIYTHTDSGRNIHRKSTCWIHNMHVNTRIYIAYILYIPYTDIYTYMCIHLHTHRFLWKYSSKKKWIDSWLAIHIHTYVHMYIHTYTYIHTYIRTYAHIYRCMAKHWLKY